MKLLFVSAAVFAVCGFQASIAHAGLVASIDFAADQGDGNVATDDGAVALGVGDVWTAYNASNTTGITIGAVGILVNEYGTGTDRPVAFSFTSPAVGVEGTNLPNPAGSIGQDSGVFDGNIFDRPDTTGNAIQITGLSAGDYKFYIYSSELNADPARDYFFSGVSAAAGPVDVSTLPFTAITGNNFTTLAENENYGVVSLTVAAGEVVSLFVEDDKAAANFTNLAGLQIEDVTIPEPASLALVALGMGMVAMRRR